MKKIIVIGAGFSGLSAISVLCNSRAGDFEVTLIDQKDEASFLPMLPDCLGRNINPEYLLFNLFDLKLKNGCNFIKDKVTSVNLEKKEVRTLTSTLTYDFLIISSGSETNFYRNNDISKFSFKVDDVDDITSLRKALDEKDYDYYLIAGAGYTGVEVATNLRLYLDNRKIYKRIIVFEHSVSILGPLPQWIKDYVANNLKRLRIEVFLNSAIDSAENNRVKLSTGASFDNPILIWCAGVRTSAYIQDLNVETNPQGRIKVDDYLRVNDTCFAAGDAAYFFHKDNFLRMAVQFAISQGNCCAKNIIRSAKGKDLVKFKPQDLGLIIPMANNRAAGRVLGVNMKGVLPIFFHYLMCIYRSYSLKNKIGIIKNLLGINA